MGVGCYFCFNISTVVGCVFFLPHVFQDWVGQRSLAKKSDTPPSRRVTCRAAGAQRVALIGRVRSSGGVYRGRGRSGGRNRDVIVVCDRRGCWSQMAT
jgi:hypothetical protein